MLTRMLYISLLLVYSVFSQTENTNELVAGASESSVLNSGGSATSGVGAVSFEISEPQSAFSIVDSSSNIDSKSNVEIIQEAYDDYMRINDRADQIIEEASRLKENDSEAENGLLDQNRKIIVEARNEGNERKMKEQDTINRANEISGLNSNNVEQGSGSIEVLEGNGSEEQGASGEEESQDYGEVGGSTEVSNEGSEQITEEGGETDASEEGSTEIQEEEDDVEGNSEGAENNNGELNGSSEGSEESGDVVDNDDSEGSSEGVENNGGESSESSEESSGAVENDETQGNSEGTEINSGESSEISEESSGGSEESTGAVVDDETQGTENMNGEPIESSEESDESSGGVVEGDETEGDSEGTEENSSDSDESSEESSGIVINGESEDNSQGTENINGETNESSEGSEETSSGVVENDEAEGSSEENEINSAELTDEENSADDVENNETEGNPEGTEELNGNSNENPGEAEGTNNESGENSDEAEVINGESSDSSEENTDESDGNPQPEGTSVESNESLENTSGGSSVSEVNVSDSGENTEENSEQPEESTGENVVPAVANNGSSESQQNPSESEENSEPPTETPTYTEEPSGDSVQSTDTSENSSESPSETLEEPEDYTDPLQQALLQMRQVLASSVSEALALTPSESPTSEELLSYISALQVVKSNMDDLSDDFNYEATISLNNSYLDEDDLKDYIKSLRKQAKVLQHYESVQQAADLANQSYGDGSTSAQLSNFIDNLKNLASIMKDDDTAEIIGKTLNRDQVKDLISDTKDDLKELSDREKVNNQVSLIKSLQSTKLTSSAQAEALIQAFKSLLDILDDTNTDLVNIGDTNYDKKTIKDKISQLQDADENFKRQDEILELAAIVQQYIDMNTGVNAEAGEVVYVTPDDLSNQRDAIKSLIKVMTGNDTVSLSGQLKTEDDLKKDVDDLSDTIDNLEDKDLIEMIIDGQVKLVAADVNKVNQRILENSNSAQMLLPITDSTTSDTIKDLIDLLNNVVDDMEEVGDEDDGIKSIQLTGQTYVITSLKAFISDLKEELKAKERKEELDSLVQSIIEIETPTATLFSYSDVNSLIKSYKNLGNELKPSETVSINDVTYDSTTVATKLSLLKSSKSQMDDDELLQKNPDGSFTVIDAVLQDTSSLSEESFNTIASEVNDNDDVLITSPPIKGPLRKPGSSFFLQLTDSSVVNGFLRNTEDAPTDPLTLGYDYASGETQFVLITSYTSQDYSGRVWAINADNPEKYNIVVEGLSKPSGVCFDVNHDFLYVADVDTLYQFSVTWKDDKTFERDSDDFLVLYSGSPGDCKVDAYGNLYFSDISSNTLNKIAYADLYNAVTGSVVVVYENSDLINRPVSLDLLNNQLIYYVNNVDNGSMNEAVTEANDDGEEPIVELASNESQPWGIAVTPYAEIYYATGNGEVKSYHSDDNTVHSVYGPGSLVKPRGLCYGNDLVYLTDNSAGFVYSTRVGSTDKLDVFVIIQSPTACFCVNQEDYDDDDDSAFALSVGVAVVLAVFY